MCRSPSTVMNDQRAPRIETVAPRPVEGTQPRWTAKIKMSTIPTQNPGSEKPKIEPAIIADDVRDFGRSPANRPSGMPITMASNVAPPAISKVAGIRSRMRLIAG